MLTILTFSRCALCISATLIDLIFLHVEKTLFRGFRWNFRVTFNILRFHSILGTHAAWINKINNLSAISYLFSFLLDAPCAKKHFSSGIPLYLPFSSLSFCFILLDLLLHGSTWMCKHFPLSQCCLSARFTSSVCFMLNQRNSLFWSDLIDFYTS